VSFSFFREERRSPPPPFRSLFVAVAVVTTPIRRVYKFCKHINPQSGTNGWKEEIDKCLSKGGLKKRGGLAEKSGGGGGGGGSECVPENEKKKQARSLFFLEKAPCIPSGGGYSSLWKGRDGR